MNTFFIKLNNNIIIMVSTISQEDAYSIESSMSAIDVIPGMYQLSDDYTIVDGKINGTIEKIPITIELDQKDQTISIGSSLSVIATISNAQDSTILFKSEDKNIATISYNEDMQEYEIVGITAGQTNIDFISKEDRSVITKLLITVE